VARLFGTDGVRGVVGKDLTADLAYDVGRAAVAVLGRHGERQPLFVVGRDTRASGPMLERELADGISAAGGHVLLTGVQTTPAVAFLTVAKGAQAGVVLSASHNPPEYNGVKIFGGDGYKLSDDLEDEIEQLVAEKTEPAVGPGRIQLLSDGTERYLAHLTTGSARIDGMTVVVDCANGAASGVAPEALRRLGAEVHSINDEPDGENINAGCGALHPEVVAAEVVRLGADAGVAHDGDADRALFADSKGIVIDGDQVLAACAIALKENGRLAGDSVVSTVMANLGFRRVMKEAGIGVVEAKVGDRYVLEEMRRTGAVLGGEQSGHIIFAERATTGDGILTAIEFLSLAAAKGVAVADLANVMRHFPQVLVNVEVADREALGGAKEVWDAVAAAEAELGERGRVLVRASGTEPLVRVMVEAESEKEASGHAETLADLVKRALG